MGLSEHQHGAIAEFIAQAAGATEARVARLERLGGGAVQENYGLEIDVTGGELTGQQSLVLRTDSPSCVSISLSRPQEFAVLQTAFAAGVAVPEPLWLCENEAVLGRPFFIMRRLRGSASGRPLVRSAMPEAQRETLVEQLGEELARLHRVRPPVDRLDFLPVPEPSPTFARIALYRRALDALPGAEPALEWGLRWLEQCAPAAGNVALCHSDYRTGNYMVDGRALTGIVDWEFASWSDPYEDLGWFCARCWRFGAWDREAGGLGSRTAFYRGYEHISGRPVDYERVGYWEAMAAVRWAIIALQQAERHLSGEQTSLELALTGRMVPEMELDMFLQIHELEKREPARA
ncbi:MAG: phosphotransferase family protein [Acidiferrobacterales bacterium]